MSDFTIRRAGVDDRDSLVRLIADFYGIDGHHFDAARVGAGLAPLLQDDRRGQVWLGMRAGAAVGYTVTTWGWSLESGGLECLVDELYVSERGGGLGSALLRHAMSAAREAGAASMFLETEAPNSAARRFYQRHGFSTEDSVWLQADL